MSYVFSTTSSVCMSMLYNMSTTQANMFKMHLNSHPLMSDRDGSAEIFISHN